MSNDEPVYLLSLDGGGIRGISELIILHEIMRRFQKVAGLAELPKPCDYFHLIGGTSTGGLIAIMLGRMGMTTEEAIDCYLNFSRDIFRNSNRRLNLTYREKTLENRIKEVVTKQKLETSVMIDEGKEKGLAFVCSVPEDEKTEPYLFRTYRGTANDAHNAEIWEAARATTAAPTFFKPMLIKIEASWRHYVDGALAVNNPAKLVLKEAEAQFGTGRRLGFLLSLGTGLKANDKAVNVDADAESVVRRAVQGAKPRTNSGALISRGTLSILKHAKEGVTDPEPTHHELNERFSGTPNAYFRLNLDHGASDIKLNQYKKMNILRAATEKYLRKPETSIEIDEVVDLLHNRGGAMMPLASAVRARSDESDKHAVNRTVQNRTDLASGQFTGREEILTKMEQHFFVNPSTSSSSSRRLLRIWGMGGVGKTQIAVRFRDLHGSKFDHVFWINAAATDSVYESFRQVTEAIFGGEHSRPDIKRVHQWMKVNQNWLLVFDNNDSIDVSIWVPPGDTGNILFTSRRADIQPKLDDSQTFAIDAMSEDDAVKLLLKSADRYAHDLDQAEKWYVRDIAKELGCLPLALDQAGSYIKLMESSFSTYYFDFKKRRKEFLEDPSMARGAFEHNPAVYGTLELSYEALIKRTREDNSHGRAALNALRILNIFCFYDNNNLTDELIARAATNERFDKDYLGDADSLAPLPLFDLKDDKSWDNRNYAKGISLLRSYSLIKSSATNDKWYSMHVLVHSWARDRMHEDVFRFQRQAARSIIFDCWRLQYKFEDEVFLAQVLPHIKAVMERGGAEDGDWFKMTWQDSKYAKLLLAVGMWRDALRVMEKVVEDRRANLETGNWLLIKALWDLGKIYQVCCKFEAASETITEALHLLPECDRKGWAVTNIWNMSIDLAEILMQQGFYGSAQAILNDVIEREYTVPFKTSPSYLRAIAALAMVMQLTGKLDEAEGLEVRILAECSDDPKYGPGDRLTVNATSNIATLWSAKGLHEKADRLWRDALYANERFRGKEHPNTLQSKRNVAIGCVKLGNLDEAETILREVLEASDRVLWRTHTETLKTIECLAEVLYQKGGVEEAIELQKECLDGRLEVLGDEHHLTVKTVRELEKMVGGQSLGAEELAQVQWQGDVSNQTGDSNFALQGMNDRYLY